MGPAGSKAVLVPQGNPAWTRQLCAELTTSPSPVLALLVLPGCVRAQEQHCLSQASPSATTGSGPAGKGSKVCSQQGGMGART